MTSIFHAASSASIIFASALLTNSDIKSDQEC